MTLGINSKDNNNEQTVINKLKYRRHRLTIVRPIINTYKDIFLRVT